MFNNALLVEWGIFISNLGRTQMKGSKSENLLKRRRFNKKILECIIEIKGDCPSALIWLKQNVDFEVCSIMLSDWKYSSKFKVLPLYIHHLLKFHCYATVFFSISVSETLYETIIDKYNFLQDKVDHILTKNLHFVIKSCLKITYNGIKRLIKIIGIYFDLTTDFILLTTILNVLGLENFTWKNFQTFSVQIAMLLLISIIIPLLISAIMITKNSPLVILSADQANISKENKSQNRMVFALARIIIVIFFPFIPAVIGKSNF